jgi:hypothetical protein
MRTEITEIRNDACGDSVKPKPLTFNATNIPNAGCQAQQDLVTQGLPQEEVYDFQKELRQLINRFCKESASNTPDYILAEYLCSCLDVFSTTVRAREQWYGRRTF